MVGHKKVVACFDYFLIPFTFAIEGMQILHDIVDY